MSPAEFRAAADAAPSTRHRTRVLLVDDQAMVGEAVRRMLASEPDLDFCYCGDPTRAIPVANEFLPTVILQDLVMPDVDGLTLLRFYRANPQTRDVPTIVLSTKEDPKVKAEAFSLGAHDYLVKLPDPVELTARIRHHSHGYIAEIDRREAYQALKASQERLAAELGEAAKYVISLLPPPTTGDVSADWRFIPSVELGGDAFGYHFVDPDHFAIYLLDVCGHGFKAALLSISAMNVLRNQTLAATDFRQPAQVLSAMNEAFQMDRHDGMYFSLWYGVYQLSSRRLTFGSGGHPSAILMAGNDRLSALPVELASSGLIIGAMPNSRYPENSCVVPAFGRLYVFSDGVYEVERPDGTMLTFREFVDRLATTTSAATALEPLVTWVRGVRGGGAFEDDVSILEVGF